MFHVETSKKGNNMSNKNNISQRRAEKLEEQIKRLEEDLIAIRKLKPNENHLHSKHSMIENKERLIDFLFTNLMMIEKYD